MFPLNVPPSNVVVLDAKLDDNVKKEPLIADELRRQADNFIELDGLRDVIGRPPREDEEIEQEYAV